MCDRNPPLTDESGLYGLQTDGWASWGYDASITPMDSEKYQGRYRIKSARHPTWDYATPAAYFVTICTHERHPYFGHLRNRAMRHSPVGQMAWDIWHLIPGQFPHCRLDACVVMPDHIHGILMLVDDGDRVSGGNNGRDRDRHTRDGDPGGCRDAINRVSTSTPMVPPPAIAPKSAPLIISSTAKPSNPNAFPTVGGITGHHNPMIGKSVSRIVRWYKGRCTYEIRKIRPDFAWQTRFYDRIIRDDDALQATRYYIRNNAAHHS